MKHILQNDKISVTISDKGAEIVSAINKADGCEYIWQGDAKYWDGQAPVLFPVCSTFFEDRYSCLGKEYKMGIHGFAQYSDFKVISKSDEKLVLLLTSNDETKEQYPFDFEFELTYTLLETRLTASARMKNAGAAKMPVTFGAHPGFNLPFTKGGDFEDYYIEFDEKCSPRAMVLTEECFCSDEFVTLELENGKRLRLKHSLFTPDGIFMEDMARKVTLRSDTDERFVAMEYPDMPYFGIWQEYSADTPFLCLEPWCAPPDNKGVPQDIFERKGLFILAPNEEKNVSYSIIFG